MIVLSVHHLIQTELFLSKKKTKNNAWLVEENTWVCSKTLQHGISSCPSWPVIKNWHFLILYEEYQMSSCTTCLIRNSDTPVSLAMYLIDLLQLLLMMTWTPPTNLEVLIRMIKVRPLSCHIFIITIGFIQLFFNPLHCTHINHQTLWNLCIGASSMNTEMVQFMLFPNFLKSEMNHGTVFLTDGI